MGHVSIMVNTATVMAWKVEDNMTNAVEGVRSTSTVVGAGDCVIYPRLFTALNGRMGHGQQTCRRTLQLFTATVRHGEGGKNCCPTCPAYNLTHSLSGLKFVLNFTTFICYCVFVMIDCCHAIHILLTDTHTRTKLF